MRTNASELRTIVNLLSRLKSDLDINGKVMSIKINAEATVTSINSNSITSANYHNLPVKLYLNIL
jgi:hypothetical protein